MTSVSSFAAYMLRLEGRNGNANPHDLGTGAGTSAATMPAQNAPSAGILSPLSEPQVNFQKRLVVVDWLAVLSYHHWIQSATFCSAVALLDRYVSCTPSVRREDYQYLGAIALLVASKMKEYDPIPLQWLMQTCPLPKTRCPRTGCMVPWSQAHPDGGEEALSAFYVKMEFRLCTALGWTLSPPTVVDWIELLCRQLGCVADAAADLFESARNPAFRVTPSGRTDGGLRIQLTQNSFAALVRCSARMHGAGTSETVRGHAVIPSDAVTFPPALAQGSWPVTVTIAGGQEAPGRRRRDTLKLGSRTSCKLLRDANTVASAVVYHADYARFPPSILAAAVLMCVLDQYQQEAVRLALTKQESLAEGHNHPVSGTTDVAKLSRLGSLRPVLWQLLAAYLLPSGQHGMTSASSTETLATPHSPAPAHSSTHILTRLDAAQQASTLLTPPNVSSSACGKRSYSAMLNTGGDARSGPQDAGEHRGPGENDFSTSVWPLLPSALVFVRPFVDDMPLPSRHGEFDEMLAVAYYSKVLPYMQLHDPDMKTHVEAVEHCRAHGEGLYSEAWAFAAFPEMTPSGLAHVLKLGETPHHQKQVISSYEEETMGYALTRKVSSDAAMLQPHTPAPDSSVSTRGGDVQQQQPTKRPRLAVSPARTFGYEEPIARPTSSAAAFLQKQGKLSASSQERAAPLALPGQSKAGTKRPLFMEPPPSSSQGASQRDARGTGSEPGSGPENRHTAAVSRAGPAGSSASSQMGSRPTQGARAPTQMVGSSRATKLLAAAAAKNNASDRSR